MRGHRTIGSKNSRSDRPADVDPDADEVLGNWTGVEPETATPIGPRSERHRSRLIAPAAAEIVVLLAALIGWAVGRGEDSPSAAPASHAEVGSGTGPVLLAPPMDGHPPILESEDGRVSPILYAAEGRSAEGFIRGAVRTPSGEIIGMTVPGPRRCCGGMGGSEMIGGRTVGVFMAPGDVRWGYRVAAPGFEGCYDVGVTTSAGLEPSPSSTSFNLPPDVVTFFEHLTLTGRVVTVRLPPGWQSLGVAASSDRYAMRFVDEAPAVATLPEFELDQRPNTGVGVFLADPRATNPRPTTMSGRPAWLITGDGGWITLVFGHDGTAVSLGARGMTDEQMVAYAATLVPQPWSETLELVDARSATQPPVDEQHPEGLPLSDYCDVSLELIEHDRTTPESP